MSENKKAGLFYGYVIVAAAFLVMAFMWGGLFTFAVFFEPLLETFGWSRAGTSGAYSLALLLVGPFGILAGKLTDRFGPRPVVIGGALLFGAGFLLLSQVSTLGQFYLYYGVVGAGMGTTVVPMASTVARWFTRRRGMMTGIALAGLGVGVMVFPTLTAGLLLRFQWTDTYRIIGIIVTVVLVLVAQVLKRDPSRIGQLPFGADRLAGLESAPVISFTLRQALRNRQFWLLTGAFFGFIASSGAIPAHIILHATGLGIPSANAAVILAVIGGSTSLGRVVVGIVADKIGCKKSLVIVLLLEAAALFWLLTIRELWMFYVFAALFGFGHGGAVALMSPSIAQYFGLSSHGIILGVIMNGNQIIESASTVAAGYIFDVSGSYYPAFVAFAVASFLGALLAWRLKPVGLNQYS
ncbi:MAG: MFS transporter, partial [Dehalococcoidales bacterium]